MTFEQAINILKPSGDTAQDLRSAYLQACKQYHPDVNPNGLELMKLINLAYEFLTKHTGKWSYKSANSKPSIIDDISEIFDKIKRFNGIEAEVCGIFLWLSGETWRYKKQLKECGFRWSHNKFAWYWRPADYRKKSG